MGKWIVIGMTVVVSVMSIALYWTFKNQSLFSEVVVTKMRDEFASYATQIARQERLQVAEIKQLEVFQRTSSLSLFWQQIHLPDVVVSISAPVTFSYFVDLKKPWSFKIDNGRLVALVPSLEFNPPAVDLSATRFEIKKGSLFRDEQRVLKDLQAKVSQLLEDRAVSNKALIVEAARVQVVDFVKNWLRFKFPKEKDPEVVVIFQDESSPH